jgi:putative DNA primase/helicase
VSSIHACDSPQHYLSGSHTQELLKSGISAEDAKSAGIHTVTHPETVGKLLNYAHPPKHFGDCLAIPYCDVHGEPITFANRNGETVPYCRVKPENPNSRDRKYEAPLGQSSHIYISPSTREAILAPDSPLMVIEGEKKALCASIHGYPCIGLPGVWMWAAPQTEAEKKAKKPKEPRPELAAIAWEGRRVYIAFDSDLEQNRQVRNARKQLAEALTRRNAIVYFVDIPPTATGEKQGVDDYIVSHGAEAFTNLVRNAEVFDAGEIGIELRYEDDDPDRLARGFLASVVGGGKQLPKSVLPPIIYWRGMYAEWSGTSWSVTPDEDIRSRVAAWIQREYERIATRSAEAEAAKAKQERAKEKEQATAEGREYEPETVKQIVKINVKALAPATVSATLLALQGIGHIPSSTDAPSWIRTLPGEERPDPSRLLVAKNGIVDLHEFANGNLKCLSGHDPYLFNFNAVGFDFEPLAPPPHQWLSFLTSIWPDDLDCIATLQEWFGLMLVPDTSFQKILMLTGAARGGKGTICRALQKLVGKLNCCSPSLNDLGRPFGLSPMIGKSVAIIGDAMLSGRSDTAMIVERLKGISGEDEQTIDIKHKSPITTRLSVRLTLAANELPKLKDASSAIVSRLVVLPITNSWLGREDRTLDSKIAAELPGILLWAVEGLVRLRRRGYFVQPKAGGEMVEELQNISSPVKQFVAERCVLDPQATVTIDEIYSSWKSWCEDEGRDHIGPKNLFARDLRSAFPKVANYRQRLTEGRKRSYRGIRLRRDCDFAPTGSGPHGASADHREQSDDNECDSAKSHRGPQNGPHGPHVGPHGSGEKSRENPSEMQCGPHGPHGPHPSESGKKRDENEVAMCAHARSSSCNAEPCGPCGPPGQPPSPNGHTDISPTTGPTLADPPAKPKYVRRFGARSGWQDAKGGPVS